ncbi:MAG: hypothetical protein AAGC44_06855 [Planctomycetota bacterium]
MTLACAGAWQSPAQAGRLATLTGVADEQQVVVEQHFKLAEQANITVGHVVTARDRGCRVRVRIYRQLPNGNWSVVNTPVQVSGSSRGRQNILLPAGEYRVEVTARHASFTVTIDKD